MDPDSVVVNLRALAAGNAAVLAVIASAVLTAAAAWRVWPFYRRMLIAHVAAQPTDGRARYDAIDGLRGILCLLVVVHHAAITLRLDGVDGPWGVAYQRTPPSFLPGNLAVALFFAVTGFLFYSRAVERPGAFADVRAFFIGRVARIGPALWASLALVWLANRLRPVAPADPEFARELLGRALSAGGYTAKGKLILQNAGVLWTLPYEWSFYLIFPVLAEMVARGWGAWSRLAACVGIFWLTGGRLDAQPPTTFFLSGIVAVHAMNVPAVRRVAAGWVGSAVVGVVLATLPYGGDQIGGPNSLTAAAIVAMVMTMVVAGCDLFGVLRLAALRAVGAASFSVYLLHGIALYAMRPVLLSLAGRPVMVWAAVCAITAGIVLVSMASYRWIEHPGIAVGRRLARHRGATARAAAVTTVS